MTDGGQLYFLVAVFLSAIIITTYAINRILPKLRKEGITGKDIHKPGMPQVPEMGGIGIVVGLVGATLLGMILHSVFSFNFQLAGILAALLTTCIVAIIGIYDDLFEMAQATKAVLPLAAAVPMIAIELAGGNSTIAIPFLGAVDFGIFYPFLLVPLAVAVCSNLTNMLAGFNGLEAGMGIIMFAALSVLAVMNGQNEMAMLCVAMLGALIGFIRFNWYPAKLFIGDVGTFTIGAILAVAVILSNLKAAGVILALPYIIDFAIKAINRFPKSFAELRGGKLYPPSGKVRGLIDVVLKIFGGLSEKRLVLIFLCIETMLAIVVLMMYGKF